MAKVENDVKATTMQQLVDEVGTQIIPFTDGEIVKCKVIGTSNHRIVCDIEGLTYGFVPEKEFSFDTKDLKEGDEVNASVMSMENKEGYVILSLRRADRDKLWDVLTAKKEASTPVEVKVVSANRGGLMVEAGGLQGFLPVSQLSQEHYPKVEGGDPGQILQKLRRLVGETLSVKIISAEKTDEKLIFSEKTGGAAEASEIESLFEIGEVVDATITGIAAFGLFVSIKGVEGLIHISEVSWEHVDDLGKLFKNGQVVKAKIVKLEEGKVSLSIKRLQADPWVEQMKKLKVGQKIDGEVTKVTAYGAFVRLPDGLDGLVHASQASGDVDKIKKLQSGDKHQFEVIELKPESRRIGLRLL